MCLLKIIIFIFLAILLTAFLMSLRAARTGLLPNFGLWEGCAVWQCACACLVKSRAVGMGRGALACACPLAAPSRVGQQGAIAYNNWLYAPLSVLIGYPPKITATRTAIVPAMPIITLFRFLTFCRRAALSS